MSLGAGPGPLGTEDEIVELETSMTSDSTGEGQDNQSMAGRSPMQIAWARLRKDKIAVASAVIIIFFILIAIFAPVLSAIEGQTPNAQHQELVDVNGFPLFNANAQHWFGIEPRIGRDLFSRFCYGARPSLIIGTVAAVITTIIGSAAGLVAGYFGGWIDKTITWVTDFFLSLPFLLFAIALVPIITSWFGTPETISDTTNSRIRFFSLIFVLVLFGWAQLARLVRGEVLSMREKEFVMAARSLGVPTRRILVREMFPSLINIILVSLTLAIPAYISAEAGLSFLGVGLTEPATSWGLTISQAQDYFEVYPLWLWVPAGAIALLVLALSLLGDAVSDAFNPNTRR